MKNKMQNMKHAKTDGPEELDESYKTSLIVDARVEFSNYLTKILFAVCFPFWVFLTFDLFMCTLTVLTFIRADGFKLVY